MDQIEENHILNPVQTDIENYRANLKREVSLIRQHVRIEREIQGYVSDETFAQELKRYFAPFFKEISISFPIYSFELDFIERSSFQADIAFKSTKLISENKAAYFKEYCPRLVEILKSLNLGGTPVFEDVTSVGIYVNARLPANYFFQALRQVVKLGNEFGKSDIGKGKDIVIDYSSPNAAKHLHAGHVRSTIIGHVLGNMYEACGYTVHRVNYLNDWGGMGVLIEGLSTRTDENSYENKNDLLFEIYSAFRKAQKASEGDGSFQLLTEIERSNISSLLGQFSDFTDFYEKFTKFTSRANIQFTALEHGDHDAFVAWRKIVNWSIEDFERFYHILGIHQDYLTGESLYAQSGKDLVMREVSKGNVIFFDSVHAETALNSARQELETGAITSEAFDKKKEEILADIGCYVVPLERGERYVVLKKDGSTIYATRDLAALEHRFKEFTPKKLIYEVGQEQQEHFDKLFRAARKLGLVPEETILLHIYHGFYVDEATKKKLSSRDGASNIIKLLNDTIQYFLAKYEGNDDFTSDEKDYIAKTLGVGSIVFNDVKKDKKSSVPISSDFYKMMRQFEESGGAYLIYTSCRAKSILRKYAQLLPEISSVAPGEFKDVEVDLMKEILSFPEIVKKAAENEDPVKIADCILGIASLFNSYYNSTPILKGNSVQRGVILAHSVSIVIDNGLRLLHVGTLERI